MLFMISMTADHVSAKKLPKLYVLIIQPIVDENKTVMPLLLELKGCCFELSSLRQPISRQVLKLVLKYICSQWSLVI